MSKVKELSLKKNFSWNFIGSLVYTFSQFLILVLLAKLGDAGMVGLYSIGLALTAPILMFTNLQLRQVQATDTTYEYTFNDYLGLRIITGCIAIIITLVIISMNGFYFEKSIIVLLVALSKVLDSYSDVIYGQLQQKERMDYIGKSRIIKGVVTLLIVGTVLLITENLIVSLIALNLSWMLILVIYDVKKIKLFVVNLTPKFDLNKMKRLVILTLPLGIVLMLGSLNTNIPRIIVDKQLGEVALGYFAGIAYLMVAGNMFISSVGQAVAPRLAKLYKDNMLIKFKKLLSQLILFGFSIGIVGIIISILFGELILKVVYDANYSDYNELFVLIMIAALFNYSGSFLGYGLTSMRLFKIQPFLGTVWTIVEFLLITT